MAIMALTAVCSPSVADVERAIHRMGKAWPWQRHRIAKRLAPHVVREAKRRGLDPILMIATGSAETDFRPWVKGPGGELGLWQLTHRDDPVDDAAKTLAKENPGLHLGRPKWLRGKPFTKRELRFAHDLGVYVVAREIRHHIDYCKKHHKMSHGGRFALWRLKWWAKRWQIDIELLKTIVRWSHYNIGPRAPLWYYVQRIVHRYKWAYKWACVRRDT